MTDETGTDSGASSEARKRWIKDLQGALDRTGTAARTAWEATRENRVGALESAKQAAKELGEVLEKGMETARERWDTEGEGQDRGWKPQTDPGAEASPPPPPAGSGPSPTDHTSSPEEPERP